MNRKQLLNKFLANQCSAEEAKLVLSWLNEDPTLLDDLISENDWMTYIAQEKNTKRSGHKLVKLLLIFVLFGLLFVFSNLSLETTSRFAQQPLPGILQELYYNPLSQPKEIITEDGSHLKLEGGALLQVRIRPELDIRHVRVLNGKISFAVAKDPSKPFIVESHQLMTTALGTQFTVDFDSESNNVVIRLFEGKVRVEHTDTNSEDAKILKPGQQIWFSEQSTMVLSDFGNKLPAKQSLTAAVSPAAIRTKAYTYPKTIHQSQDWLQLEETSLSDIIQFINHELDMPISYDSLMVRHYRIRGRFRKQHTMDIHDKTQLAESILQLIVEVNPFVLQKQHNTYVLKPKK